MPKVTRLDAAMERREQILMEGRVLRTECPTCGADVGEECHTEPGWWPTKAHAKRLQAAGVRWEVYRLVDA